MELLNSDNNLYGGNKEFNGGFPNLILNNQLINKKQYKYNIENNINKDIINIKNILEKRKEENKPLIKIESESENNYIKKREELVSNINLSDFN
tara:strand:- start:351 stop:632 length:282 start_codon:yes stop_codon:yes gene_type:complete